LPRVTSKWREHFPQQFVSREHPIVSSSFPVSLSPRWIMNMGAERNALVALVPDSWYLRAATDTAHSLMQTAFDIP